MVRADIDRGPRPSRRPGVQGLGGKVYRVERPAQGSAYEYVFVDDIHHSMSHSVGTYRTSAGGPRRFPDRQGRGRPMVPTLVRAPFHRGGWVYEEKVDGRRMLVYKDGERVRLVSRNGRDHARRFRDIAAAISLPRRVELARCARTSPRNNFVR
jgi:ATP dependent DNA ligase domain